MSDTRPEPGTVTMPKPEPSATNMGRLRHELPPAERQQLRDLMSQGLIPVDGGHRAVPDGGQGEPR